MLWPLRGPFQDRLGRCLCGPCAWVACYMRGERVVQQETRGLERWRCSACGDRFRRRRRSDPEIRLLPGP